MTMGETEPEYTDLAAFIASAFRPVEPRPEGGVFVWKFEAPAREARCVATLRQAFREYARSVRRLARVLRRSLRQAPTPLNPYPAWCAHMVRLEHARQARVLRKIEARAARRKRR